MSAVSRERQWNQEFYINKKYIQTFPGIKNLANQKIKQNEQFKIGKTRKYLVMNIKTNWN